MEQVYLGAHRSFFEQNHSMQGELLPVHGKRLERVLVCRLTESWEYIALVWLNASVQ